MTKLNQHPTHRPALLPPAPLEPVARLTRAAPARSADPLKTEGARRAALRELSRLIVEPEGWRRRQLQERAAAPQRWALIHCESGGTIRVRLEDGRPVQIRAGVTDRDRALEIVSLVFGLALRPACGWRRDPCALDWRLGVRSL